MDLTDNILAYYKLDDDGSNNLSLVDSTSNLNTLTNNGNVQLGDGKIFGGAIFDGSNHLSGVGAFPSNWSISGWVYPPEISANTGIFGSSYLNVYVGESASNSITINDGFNASDIADAGYIAPYTWSFLTITSDGGTTSLYINGDFIASTTQDVTPRSDLNIGAYVPAGWYFYGNIDEVGIWNRALSSNEINRLYYGGVGLSYPFSVPDQTIYIRTTGNDETGNGTLALPFATAQKGFDTAYYYYLGNSILDFGVGSFGNVDNSDDGDDRIGWPSRISIRGVSEESSFIGTIQLVTSNSDSFVTYPVTIISNRSVAISSIISTPLLFQSGGVITLTGIKCNNVNANGGFAGSGGNIFLTDCLCETVQSIGAFDGENPYGDGNVSIVDTTATAVYCNILTYTNTPILNVTSRNAAKIKLVGSIAIPSLDFSASFDLRDWVAPSGGGSDGIDLARLLGLPAFVRL